jgi:hypothetical protein
LSPSFFLDYLELEHNSLFFSEKLLTFKTVATFDALLFVVAIADNFPEQ